jgi:hypothetical protein
LNKRAWNEIADSFRGHYFILIACAVIGFVSGASLAILERMEERGHVASPTPSVRSSTRTKEVKVTVTARDEQPRKNDSSYSPESPKRLNSPYPTKPIPVPSKTAIEPRPSYPETTIEPNPGTTKNRSSSRPIPKPTPTVVPEPEPEPLPTLEPEEPEETVEQPAPNTETAEPPVDDPSNYGG